MKNKLILFVILMLFISSAPVMAMSQPPKVINLANLQSDVSDALNNMDQALAQAAKQIALTGLAGDPTARLLQKIYNDYPSIVDVACIDPNGKLVLIKPDKYKGSEGSSISDQAHFPALKQAKKPILSNLFMTVEGFNAVSLAYPVLAADGTLIGFVSVVFEPQALVRNVLRSYPPDQTEVTALQLDGRIIYDKDIRQVGRMTFSDPIYQGFPSLIELAKIMVATPEGEGVYEFPAGVSLKPEVKDTQWATIGLYGTQWRLVVSKVAD